VQEDVILSDDNSTWYVTCMGSENVVVGDAVADRMTGTITMPKSYPHGIGLHEGIDRMLVTSCVAPDMSGIGETLEVIEASTGTYLGSIEVSDYKGDAPVETVFVPRSDPPVAYVTNMMADTLGAAVWNPETETFDMHSVFDFDAAGANMPLEIYFNKAVDRLYVTTAEPGHFFIFDISAGPLEPKLIKMLPAAGGAHHVAITPDEKTAYVQNSLLNIPGISDGSITVIDLEKQEVIDTINVFKEQNLTPNSITFLPDWYNQMGHFNNGPGE
jgi:DNA-binding beta-propeller fold protein YncE